MKIIVETEILEAVKRVKPIKIAVAYIGQDWESFIPNLNLLKEVIVSPTFGSNPEAVVNLAKRIGWDNVYFLNELHAKFYIGENAAVFGSANLSRNGLSENGLFELCAEVIGVEILEKLNANFEKVKLLAIKQYPTTEHKKKQIKELKTLTRKGYEAGINKVVEQKYLSFEDFDPSVEDDFYIAWYQPANVAFSDEVEICKNEGIFGNDVHFLPNDDVAKEKWVLLWRITNDNKLYARTKPAWVFIHEIFENGVTGEITDNNDKEEYSYPKLAFQRKDLAVLSKPPFEITDEIVKAFRAVVQEPSLEKYLIQKGKLFSLNEAKKGFVLFIEAMKKHLNK